MAVHEVCTWRDMNSRVAAKFFAVDRATKWQKVDVPIRSHCFAERLTECTKQICLYRRIDRFGMLKRTQGWNTVSAIVLREKRVSMTASLRQPHSFRLRTSIRLHAVPFFSLSNWETGASEMRDRARDWSEQGRPRGRASCSLQSLTYCGREKKGTACSLHIIGWPCKSHPEWINRYLLLPILDSTYVAKVLRVTCISKYQEEWSLIVCAWSVKSVVWSVCGRKFNRVVGMWSVNQINVLPSDFPSSPDVLRLGGHVSTVAGAESYRCVHLPLPEFQSVQTLVEVRDRAPLVFQVCELRAEVFAGLFTGVNLYTIYRMYMIMRSALLLHDNLCLATRCKV